MPNILGLYCEKYYAIFIFIQMYIKSKLEYSFG